MKRTNTILCPVCHGWTPRVDIQVDDVPVGVTRLRCKRCGSQWEHPYGKPTMVTVVKSSAAHLERHW